LDWFRRAAALSDCLSTESHSRWPRDPHGDVLRKLEADGFDFSHPALIDFNIRFQSRLSHHVLKRLCRDYPSMALWRIDEDCGDCLEFQVYALVSYELVVNTLSHVIELMSPCKGVRPSWAVVVVPSAQEPIVTLETVAESNQSYLM
jgi:hypothetical protein